MSLSSERIRHLGLGALVVLIALMSVQGVVIISSMEGKIDSMISEHQAELEAVDSLLSEFVEIRGVLTSFVVNEETDIKPLIQKVNDLIGKTDSLAASVRHKDRRKALNEFSGKVKQFKAAMFAYSQELLLRRTGEGVRSWEQTLLDTEHKAHAILSQLKNNLRGEMGELGTTILRQGKLARAMNIIFGIVGVFAGVVVALILQRALARPIKDLVEVTSEVSSGDLSREIEQKEIGEIGVLFGGIASMVTSLRNLVEGVQVVSRDVGTSAVSLRQYSKEVTEGASRQSSEIENVSSSVMQMDAIIKEISSKVNVLNNSLQDASSSTQEMTASTKEISSHADHMFREVDQIISSVTEISASMSETVKFMDQLSSSSQRAASGTEQLTASVTRAGERAKESRSFAEEVSRQAKVRGGDALARMLEVSGKNKTLADEYSSVIQSLGERSANIDQILNVIQDVADQTNLLSLNAAIIAAQAGEHGRGFAVVAEEIRTLSGSTTENVKQIGSVVSGVRAEVEKAVGLIGSIRDGMDSSAASAKETGDVLREIEKLSAGSAKMTAEISDSVTEQISACEVIMDVVTKNLQEVIMVQRAADEQRAGSQTIVSSVDQIRAIAERLKSSTGEQATGSELIAGTITKTHEFSEEITSVVAAEEEASQRIVSSLHHISQVAEGNLTSVKDLDKMVKDFGSLADKLSAEMGRFTLPEVDREAPE